MEAIKSAIAKNVSELRSSRGMTQLDLAEKLHYSDKAVSKWERGESVPEISTLKALADFFGVTVDYLITEEHKQAQVLEFSPYITKKMRQKRHIAITAISVISVWLLALLVYMVLDVAAPFSSGLWLCFAWAFPCCCIVWLVLNCIWFSSRTRYLIISLLSWGVFCALHLSLLCANLNLWHLYVAGGCAQVIIILSSLISTRTKK